MLSLAEQPERVRLALQELRLGLAARFGERLRELRLFGSRARGEAHAESDTDLLVVLDAVSWRDRCEVIDLATDVGLEHDVLLSPTVFDSATFELWRAQRRPLVVQIEKDGIAL